MEIKICDYAGLTFTINGNGENTSRDFTLVISDPFMITLPLIFFLSRVQISSLNTSVASGLRM